MLACGRRREKRSSQLEALSPSTEAIVVKAGMKPMEEHLRWFNAWVLHHAGSECASFETHHLDTLCFAITYSSHHSLSVHWCSEERNALRNDWNMAPSLPLKLWASAVVNGPLSWNKSVQCLKSVWAWSPQQWLFLPSQRSESTFEVLGEKTGD